MSKYLDKAIKEMRSYSDMGLPDGETGGGMGSQGNNKIANAYKMLKKQQRNEPEEWLKTRQHAQRAEEEETEMDDMRGMDTSDDVEMDDKDYKMDIPGNEAGMEVPNMDDELGMDAEVDTEEMKAFFQDNPAPSDEEVQQYADERGIDMEQMRQEVYELIQSLLGASDPVGDGEDDMDAAEDDMGGEIEFSAPVGADKIPDEEDLRSVKV